jgi:hypothetical protein
MTGDAMDWAAVLADVRTDMGEHLATHPALGGEWSDAAELIKRDRIGAELTHRNVVDGITGAALEGAAEHWNHVIDRNAELAGELRDLRAVLNRVATLWESGCDDELAIQIAAEMEHAIKSADKVLDND